jgi:hypothetical protein
MINMKNIVLGLFLILLFAGCIGMPDIFGNLIPGGNKVNKTEMSSDLVVIQNINVMPSNSVSAGDEFSVSFEIKNQDDINEVNDVYYNLYDWGLCSPSSGEVTEGTFDSLAPLQTEFKQWNFKAPDNSQIGRLPIKCPIRFKANFSYTVTSQIDIDVISKDRLDQLQRAGTPPSFTPTQTIGRGPIKIYFEIGSELPVRENKTIPIFITIEDKGQGIYGEIPNNTLLITFPPLFSISDCTKFECGSVSYCSSHFGPVTKDNKVCDINNDGKIDVKDIGYFAATSSTNGVECRNKEKIPMIKKVSPQMRCSVKVPESVDIEKTFYISGQLGYTYDVNGETSVNVKPTVE